MGNDLAEFDAGAAENAASVVKPAGEVWVSYAGNISALYDLETLVEAVTIAAKAHPELKLKILGDGPERGSVEAAVMRTGAPAELLGYMPYRTMAAWLKASDMVVNSLVANAPQSVPTKIGDYLASGRPMVNTSIRGSRRCRGTREGDLRAGGGRSGACAHGSCGARARRGPVRPSAFLRGDRRPYSEFDCRALEVNSTRLLEREAECMLEAGS